MQQPNKNNQLNKTDSLLTILESEKPLSQSMVWKLQSDFYENQGPEAWIKGIVPQYITTNPYIANLYAKTVFGYCRDIANSKDFDKATTIYIMELAAGVGRFTYTFLKKFLTMVEQSSLKGLKFKYLITDLAERNVEYWQNHSYLTPYFESGVLDCATFDIGKDEVIQLRTSGELLCVGRLKNPLILFANYTFDSIPQDTFYVNNKELFEGVITITSKEDTLSLKDKLLASEDNAVTLQNNSVPSNNNPFSSEDKSILAGLDYEYTDKPIPGSGYYEDDTINDILLYYQDCLEDTAFSLPIVALRCINQLRKLFNDDLIIISTDKGYRNIASMKGIYHPYLSKHGSISLTVNFHAMELYFKNIGGKAIHSIYEHENVTMSMFLLSERSHAFIETAMAYNEIIEGIGPDDFYIIKKAVVPYNKSLSTKEIMTFLRYTGWDSRTFLEFYNTLLERIAQEDDFPRDELVEVIHQVWAHYFPIGEEGDLASCLASILAYFEYDRDAIELFMASLEFYGEDASVHYEIALCYYNLQELENTLVHLEQSLLLDPTLEESINLKSIIEEI